MGVLPGSSEGVRDRDVRRAMMSEDKFEMRWQEELVRLLSESGKDMEKADVAAARQRVMRIPSVSSQPKTLQSNFSKQTATGISRIQFHPNAPHASVAGQTVCGWGDQQEVSCISQLGNRLATLTVGGRQYQDAKAALMSEYPPVKPVMQRQPQKENKSAFKISFSVEENSPAIAEDLKLKQMSVSKKVKQTLDMRFTQDRGADRDQVAGRRVATDVKERAQILHIRCIFSANSEPRSFAA
eukprot:614382-Hanusia_phi.AAC.2